ncbi:MAG: 2-C-methyl-D-erythritol 4-phosphate cytidylyltransferase [Candidatus Eisenbacteria bacterium]|nr:2-C-methyl-D-erythritol 4-phosphate cytidylyltransferase [Candidatus Eisenbacteria bacterium]
MRVGLVLVAAGSSTRVGGGTPKQFRMLAREPMFIVALRAVVPFTHEVVVVAPPDRVVEAGELLTCSGLPGDHEADGTSFLVVPGGKRRQDSVRKGLAALSDDVEVVLVHDAARPFVPGDVVERVLGAAQACGAAVPAVPVADTIKRVEGERVLATLDRGVLRATQTPQGFRAEVLRTAYEAADEDVTDDAQVLELAGEDVAVVEGDPGNTKVTTGLDLELARLRDAARLGVGPATRVGFGCDRHRLTPGRELVLCGVTVPFDKGLDGHSDADVATHAVMDALLGAAAAGDIGVHFPPDDDRWRGASSLDLLDRVIGIVRESGYEPGAVDVTIVAEAPRLAPHVNEMRERLAVHLGVAPGSVSVKATTTEGTGPEGAGEAMSATAVATLRPGNDREDT